MLNFIKKVISGNWPIDTGRITWIIKSQNQLMDMRIKTMMEAYNPDDEDTN